MGGFISKYPVYEEYPCFFEEENSFGAHHWATGVALETASMRDVTLAIDFDCYMSGGQTYRDDEAGWICVHNDDYPCNFQYYDAHGNV